MDEPAAASGMSVMTATSGTPDGAASAEERWAGFDRWSSKLFHLVTILTFVVLLAIGGLAGGSDIPEDIVAITLGFAAAQVVLLVIASIGLGRHWAWARTTARWLLWIMVVTGVGGGIGGLFLVATVRIAFPDWVAAR